MKKTVLFLMVAGMLAMVACKSAPKQEEQQPALQEQTDSVSVVENDTIPATE